MNMLFQNNFKRREELFKAVENANIKTVRELIRDGVDVRATDKKGRNIIMTSMKLKKKAEFQRQALREKFYPYQIISYNIFLTTIGNVSQKISKTFNRK